MGKISDNGGFYMTIIASDMIISKKTSQLLLSLNIFYFQQITSYTVQYIQFITKLELERKSKLIEFISYYRVHCDMEGGLYHINL